MNYIFVLDGGKIWWVEADKVMHMTFTPRQTGGTSVDVRFNDGTFVSNSLPTPIEVILPALMLIRDPVQNRPQPRTPSVAGSRQRSRPQSKHRRDGHSRQD